MKKTTSAFCILTAIAITAANAADAPPKAPQPPPGPKPTLADVAYGPHPKQVLHFWKAESDKPTPVLFFIHGGGWVNGNRMSVGGLLPQMLKAGISVVSVEYQNPQVE